jgi:hypothetical protein
VFVDETATLYALGWDGQAVSAPQALARGAGHSIALAGTSDAHVLAWSRRDGGIGFFRFTEAATTWADQGIAFPGVAVQALDTICLGDGVNPRLLTVWTGGGNPSALWYGFCDLAGRPSSAAVNLTANSRGHYHQPTLLSSGLQGTLLARFSDDPTEELREFELRYPDGLVNADRDQDGMNDVGELLVVDADPLDSVRTIDDVRPQDDFDQDGYPNAREVGLGLNPGDAGNHPALQVLIEPAEVRDLGARWRLEGGEWLASGAALFLRPGQYQLEFREVAVWSTPRPRMVVVTEGEAANLIVRYVQGGVPFETWAGALVPPLPPGRDGPDHVNGTWGLPNFVAYALGSHPLEAEADALPRLELQGTELVYTYRLSKTALDVAYRIAMAPEVAAEVWQEMPDGVHAKVGETGDAELWQLRVAAPAVRRQAYFRFEVLRLP